MPRPISYVGQQRLPPAYPRSLALGRASRQRVGARRLHGARVHRRPARRHPASQAARLAAQAPPQSPQPSARTAASAAAHAARRRRMAPRPSPAERLAGLAFIAFTLMQVPFLVLHSELVPGPSKLLPLAPLQVTAASLAQRLGPRSHLYLTDVLTPGAWVTGALSPFLRCALLGHGAAGSDAGSSSWGRCSVQRSRLLDLQFARAQVRLPLLLALLEGRALGAGQQFVVYGSGLVVLSALFSLYYSVRSAVVGFLLLGAGVYKGNLVPLPPLVLVAFLCVYAGFSWEKGSGQRTRVGRRQPGVTVKPLATQQQRQPGGQKQATPPQKKQKQKQGRRRA